MEEIYLQIIEKYGDDFEDPRYESLIASELADINKKFNLWKDNNTLREMHGKYCIAPLRASDEMEYYTLDDLFKYWYSEIFLKKQS